MRALSPAATWGLIVPALAFGAFVLTKVLMALIAIGDRLLAGTSLSWNPDNGDGRPTSLAGRAAVADLTRERSV